MPNGQSRHYHFLRMQYKRKTGNVASSVTSVLGMFFEVVFLDGGATLACTVTDFDEVGFDFMELNAVTDATQTRRYELSGKSGSVEFKDIKLLLAWDEKTR